MPLNGCTATCSFLSGLTLCRTPDSCRGRAGPVQGDTYKSSLCVCQNVSNKQTLVKVAVLSPNTPAAPQHNTFNDASPVSASTRPAAARHSHSSSIHSHDEAVMFSRK